LGEAVMRLGERQDIARVMSVLDLYASASRMESYLTSKAEAVSCGAVPFVTAAGGSAVIVFGHGAVVPVRSLGRLAEMVLASMDTIRRLRASRGGTG